MESSSQMDDRRLSLTGKAMDLSYDLGEMPQLYRVLKDYMPFAFLESREGTEKFARYGIVAAKPLVTVYGKGSEYIVVDDSGARTFHSTNDPLELLRSLQPPPS